MPNRLPITVLSKAVVSIAIVGVAILASPLSAQVTAPMRGAGSGTMGVAIGARPTSGVTPGFAGAGVAVSPSRMHHQHFSGRHTFLLPYPYFYSDYATDN